MSNIVSNSETGLRIITPGSGLIALPNLYPFNDASSNKNANYNSNLVYGFLINIPYPFLWKNAMLNVNTSSAGSHFSVGLYNLAKNLLVSTGAMAGDSPGNVISTLTNPYMIQPGSYYFCWTSDDSALGMSMSVGLDSKWSSGIRGLSSTNEFTAANSSAAGVLPATLGTLSGVSISNSVGGNSPPMTLIYA